MIQKPLTEDTDPSKASDAQKIALYIANLLLAKGGIGNLIIATGDRPVMADDFVAFKGTTGLKVYDSGYGPGSFVTPSQVSGSYQRSERRVLLGETRTVPFYTSDTINGPMDVADGGAIVIEDNAVLRII